MSLSLITSEEVHAASASKEKTNWSLVWGVNAISWLVLSFLEVITVYPMRISQGRPLPFWMMFKDVFLHNLLGMVLTPGIYYLALKFPFSPRRILKPTMVHLSGSIFFAFANTAQHYLMFPLHVSPDSYEKFTWMLFYGFMSYAWFLDTSTTYIPVLAIAYMCSYYQKYRENEMQKLRLDAQLAQAQLQFLRSQLNPHFLFNTLHSITSLMHFDIDAADKMMAQLSDLLRMALQQADVNETELKYELDFVDRYLAIEKTRLGDRLRISRSVSEEAKQALVPPLILQPLVENAVIHGVSQQVEGGELFLRAIVFSGTLRLTVRNKGSLRTPSFRPPGHSGVGIRNIRERLNQMYGGDHSFVIEEDGKGGVEVAIILPLRTAAVSPNLTIDQVHAAL
ncbi:periplasmic sensor signal transduction histidine kinase [Candidatus Koribacter versatilis Ellin345]|uniref:Periplasmic sensor signal transduction histidine kinase n=1 Tax=Koribacter versatilis (strain Ellin345) TaxID=204669 RepID=Q1IUM6_KORVE|nr:histidine kinase [Candidatus Koribacter versatilis]ABF39424.1 periplasmic sensor signal transduction histidine kinase [Candidatus Koribacter versatilis Ellin345]